MADFQYARHVQAGGYDDGIRPTLNPASKFVCSYFAACIAQTSTFTCGHVTVRRLANELRVFGNSNVSDGHDSSANPD